MNRYIALSMISFLLFFVGCNPKPPGSFVELHDASMMGWKTIELREGLEYEEAWETLVDIVAMKWDVETMDKDAGYLRSSWSYMTGKDPMLRVPFTYGRRLSAKFNRGKRQLLVKTEAIYQVREFAAIYGVDSAFNEDVFTEISGKIGRTTR